MANHLWNLRQGSVHTSNCAPISPSNNLWSITSTTALTEPFSNSRNCAHISPSNSIWHATSASDPTQCLRPDCNSLIACRLCNKVFLSTEALIKHIHSHISHEENNLRTLNFPQQVTPERGQVLNGFSPNIYMQMTMQGTRNLADNRTVRAPQQPAMLALTRRQSFGSGGGRVFLPPPQRTRPSLENYSSASRNNNLRARMDFPVSHFQMEESASDGTRPYIKQLEKPIKSVEIIHLVEDNNSLQALDLSLTL